MDGSKVQINFQFYQNRHFGQDKFYQNLYIGDIKIKLWMIGKLKRIERKRMFECQIINIREVWVV